MKKLLAILAAAMFIGTGCTDQAQTPVTPAPSAPAPTASATPSAAPTETPDAEKHARIEPGEKKEVKLGEASLTSEWLRTETPIKNDSYSKLAGIVSPEKNIIVLAEKNMLTAYRLGKGGLRIEKSYFNNGILELPQSISYISCDRNGTMYISGGVFRIATVGKKGIIKEDKDAKGYFFPSPDGKWGASCFVGADSLVFKDLTGDTFPSEVWFFSNMNEDDTKRKGKYCTIDFIDIRDNEFVISGGVPQYVDVNGKKEKRSTKYTTCYSLDGKEKYTFEHNEKSLEPSRIGWVHGSFESKYGNVIVDSNLRKLKLFDKTGKFIDNAELKDLLGVEMWPKAAYRIDDSTVVLTGIANSTNDYKYKETMIFLIKGI